MNIFEFIIALLIWIVAPVTSIAVWLEFGAVIGILCSACTVGTWVWSIKFDSSNHSGKIEQQVPYAGDDYSFHPEWKEVLVCKGPTGSFWLDFPMGIPTVMVPTREQWIQKFPGYDYNVFNSAITEWLNKNNIAYGTGGSIND